MVGQRFLAPLIEVRVLIPQLSNLYSSEASKEVLLRWGIESDLRHFRKDSNTG